MNNLFSLMNNPFGNVQNMLTQFNKFKQTFQGDPQQTINQMLQSGKINQAQIDQAKQMAEQFQRMLK